MYADCVTGGPRALGIGSLLICVIVFAGWLVSASSIPLLGAAWACPSMQDVNATLETCPLQPSVCFSPAAGLAAPGSHSGGAHSCCCCCSGREVWGLRTVSPSRSGRRRASSRSLRCLPCWGAAGIRGAACGAEAEAGCKYRGAHLSQGVQRLALPVSVPHVIV